LLRGTVIRTGVLALAAMLLHLPAFAQHSAPVEKAVTAVRESIDAARRRQQSLPAPTGDADRLIRMGQLEQAPRDALATLDMASLSSVDRQAVWAAVGGLIEPIDHANQQELLTMVPADGWFSISRYGRDAARAAFLIVQHADQSLWRRFLPKIEEMVRAGEAEGPAYALMYDRLALSENRPQRYGSQMGCKDGRYATLEPFEDPASIDTRRSALGLIPYADYLKIYANMRC
jgi:hypothetical protein